MIAWMAMEALGARPVRLVDLNADFGSVVGVLLDDGAAVLGAAGRWTAAPFSEPVVDLGRVDRRVGGSDHPPPVTLVCGRLASNTLECVWTEWDAGFRQVWRRERLDWTQGLVGALRRRAEPTELAAELCFDPPAGGGPPRCAGWNRDLGAGAPQLVEVPAPPLAPLGPAGVLVRSSHEVGGAGGFAEARCALADAGAVACTGSALFGGRGDGASDGGPRGGRAKGVTGAVELLVARGTACARTADGRVACWGQDADRFGAPRGVGASTVPWCRGSAATRCAVPWGEGSDPVDPAETRGLPVFRAPVWTADLADAVDAVMLSQGNTATLYVLRRAGGITTWSGDYGEYLRQDAVELAPTALPLRP